ncbi:hypothetical protein ACLMJK_000200 [Lecanora helva]
MDEKCVDPSVQVDIDEMILDYLIFNATKSALNDFEDQLIDAEHAHQQRKTNRLSHLVDSYLNIFHAIHPEHHGSRGLRFRLRLLKFTIMFTKRSIPSDTKPSKSELRALGQKRQNEARSFRSGDKNSSHFELPNLIEDLDLPDGLAINNGEITPMTGQVSFNPSGSDVPSPKTRLSLLDTLPAFMALSAAQTAMQEGTITDVWMHLAAGYMVQAVVEQYLVFKSQRKEVLREAFAWGFDADCDAAEGSDEWQINAMFFGESEIVSGWDRIRDEHMHALIPPEGSGLQEHLELMVAGDLSVPKFDQYILNFLTGLHLALFLTSVVAMSGLKMEEQNPV